MYRKRTIEERAARVLSRAMTYVDRSDADGCWPWMRAKRSAQGHGGIWDGHRWTHAHRYFYQQLVGPIPDGLEVRHTCDNPPCCRPDHLILGTHAENMADMKARGRSTPGERYYFNRFPERRCRGETHGHAKLNEAQVRDIRRRYAEGGISYSMLAREYGVSQSTVSEIVLRKIWQHVT